jgi:hypothetical protein
MRKVFIADLIREILGPRDGIQEQLDGDPRALYITGVLAPELPEGEGPVRDPEAEAQLPVERSDLETGEEDTDDRDESVAPVFSPALDPRELPRSIGLTFALGSGKDVSLEICVSWARYESGDGHTWIRRPRAHVVGPLLLAPSERKTIYLDATGPCSAEQTEVSLYIASRPMLGESRTMVTIYLTNQLIARRRGDTAAHIFQPQIRVLCGRPLVSVISTRANPDDTDAARLDFLQRNRPVRARGHLCSAVWREIDPELPPGESGNLPDTPPFTWPDGAVLPDDQRARFSPPDVRTEFVPVLAIETPRAGWPERYGRRPQLVAAALAECWTAGSLRTALDPLIAGYEAWVQHQRRFVETMQRENDSGTTVARRICNECEETLRRMRAGIDLLVNDTDARLAFCFACAAIDLQHRWGTTEAADFEWRPFQLGFMLSVLESLVRPHSYDRDVCDLLWVPTGLGKTEAYLGLAAFAMAYRRRRALRRHAGNGGGTAVISRYTLRLLTIQQFRRALGMITACEFLRVQRVGPSGFVGWRPRSCGLRDEFLWGSSRFSIGLWVGGNVTPNRLRTIFVDDGQGGKRPLHGAIDLLKGVEAHDPSLGEPAQALECPACRSLLAATDLTPGLHTLYWIVRTDDPASVERSVRSAVGGLTVVECTARSHPGIGYSTLCVRLELTGHVPESTLDRWLTSALPPGTQLACARPSRPGYFLRMYAVQTGKVEEHDFDIFCPNPDCPLNRGTIWAEGVPADDGLLNLGMLHAPTSWRRMPEISKLQQYEITLPGRTTATAAPDGLAFRVVPECVRPGRATREDRTPLYLSTRIPIPAMMMDEQVYHRCPSMVISTVDKFARLAYEPRAAGIFGHVNRYHPRLGYYREDQPTDPGGPAAVACAAFDPPDLILQDELHLIEGPLGSLTGLYELAVETLCKAVADAPGPKYIASTATIRQAREQIGSLFVRRVLLFPPHGMDWNDRFFLEEHEPHPADEEDPGRLYVGVCCPGRGPLTPIVRIFARLLQSGMEERHRAGDVVADPYWTLVAYFNAVRELAGARALYRQDIPEWIARRLARGTPGARALPDDEPYVLEFSSARKSTDLPQVFGRLERKLPGDAVDSLFTTSMFGTGVDVRRLNLMVVNGQPKTTSAYIQATGRVGRTRGALVVAFLRASRPRDLSHYEFFCGYHRRLFTFVEPVTVMPFSSGAVERACGPVSVALLRNRRGGTFPWHRDGTARDMRSERMREGWIADLFESRATDPYQPPPRRPPTGNVQILVKSALDLWQQRAEMWTDLTYVEYAIGRPPLQHVVLGDAAHRDKSVYPFAMQSLRDIEDTVAVEV